MKNFLIIILIVPALFYLVFRDLRRMKKIEDKKHEREKKLTTEQKAEKKLKQDQKHKIFLFLTMFGILLMFLLKDTLVGFFIGFGILGLIGRIFFDLFERWSKNQAYNKKMFLVSFALVVIIVVLWGLFFMPQMGYIYQDKI